MREATPKGKSQGDQVRPPDKDITSHGRLVVRVINVNQIPWV
jgi:hypothetical protein